MGDDRPILATADTRDEAIEVSIAMARSEAMQKMEVVEICVCVAPSDGKPCPFQTVLHEACPACEMITIQPSGLVARERRG